MQNGKSFKIAKNREIDPVFFFVQLVYHAFFWYDTLVVVKLLHWEFHIIWSFTQQVFYV